MRRLLAVAPILLVAFASAPSLLSAQRGAGHGGFSGRSSFSGPAFHGGFSGSGPVFRGFSQGASAGAPRYGFTAPRYYVGSPRVGAPFTSRFGPSARSSYGGRTSFASGFAGNGATGHSDYAAGDGHRPPYRRGNKLQNNWASGINTYGYLGYPDFYLYPPWLWDYDDSFDGSQAYAPQDTYPPQDYGYPYPPSDQSQYPELPPWPDGSAPQSSAPAPTAAAPQPAEAVTIVFNDGRPPEKIQNYLLTPTTLYVMDLHRSEIPVAEVNLAATAKVNREAGIDFAPPGSSR